MRRKERRRSSRRCWTSRKAGIPISQVLSGAWGPFPLRLSVPTLWPHRPVLTVFLSPPGVHRVRAEVGFLFREAPAPKAIHASFQTSFPPVEHIPFRDFFTQTLYQIKVVLFFPAASIPEYSTCYVSRWFALSLFFHALLSIYLLLHFQYFPYEVVNFQLCLDCVWKTTTKLD